VLGGRNEIDGRHIRQSLALGVEQSEGLFGI
jgi:hypothetical protein